MRTTGLRGVRGRAAMAGALCALVGLGVGGCFQSETGLDIAGLLRSHGPSPDSPAGVLRLFEWSYNHLDISAQHELFSGDFRFYFSPTDSAGVPYRTTPWTRDDELISATRLFEGGNVVLPPASTIQLTFDRNFIVDPSPTVSDPEGAWHKSIRTQVVLNIMTADGSLLYVSGSATFYMVRGDAAVIPDELKHRGVGSDPNRWYIHCWDDETASGAVPARARWARDARGAPARSLTWGTIKAHYRSDRLP